MLVLCAWLNKIFQFGNGEFLSAKNEVARCNFVTECLADLRNTERQFHPCRFKYGLKIGKHCLGKLPPQIYLVLLVFYRTNICFEKQIKIFWLSPDIATQ